MPAELVYGLSSFSTSRSRVQVTVSVGASGPASPAQSAEVRVTSSPGSAGVPASSVIVISARSVPPVFSTT